MATVDVRYNEEKDGVITVKGANGEFESEPMDYSDARMLYRFIEHLNSGGSLDDKGLNWTPTGDIAKPRS